MTYAHYRISTGSGPRRLVALSLGIVVPVLSIIALDQGLSLYLVDRIAPFTAVVVHPTPTPPPTPAPPPPNPGPVDVGNVDVPPPIITVDNQGGDTSITPTSGPDTPARSFASNNALYPDSAKTACEQGTVTLNLQIGADGRVSDVSIANSSGYPSLDNAALQSARHWRFTPARRNGVAVASTIVQPVRFDLKNEIGGSMTAAEVRECLKG